MSIILAIIAAKESESRALRSLEEQCRTHQANQHKLFDLSTYLIELLALEECAGKLAIDAKHNTIMEYVCEPKVSFERMERLKLLLDELRTMESLNGLRSHLPAFMYNEWAWHISEHDGLVFIKCRRIDFDELNWVGSFAIVPEGLRDRFDVPYRHSMRSLDGNYCILSEQEPEMRHKRTIEYASLVLNNVKQSVTKYRFESPMTYRQAICNLPEDLYESLDDFYFVLSENQKAEVEHE